MDIYIEFSKYSSVSQIAQVLSKRWIYIFSKYSSVSQIAQVLSKRWIYIFTKDNYISYVTAITNSIHFMMNQNSKINVCIVKS